MPVSNNPLPRGALALIVLAGSVLLIMLASDLNGGHIQNISFAHPGIDKLAHFGMHLAVVLALYAILRRYWPQLGAGFALGLAAGVSALFGLLDEGHQHFISGRDFDPFDVAANLCGTATAAVLLIALTKRAPRRLILAAIPLSLFIALLLHAQAQMHYYNEGLVQVRAGNFAAARQAFLTALEQGHASPGLYNELAWVELEYLTVDPAPALDYTARALAYQPDNADFLDTRGWALFRNGRYAEALDILLKAYASDPGIYCIHYHLGATYLALGRNAEGIEHLTRQLADSTDTRFADKARTLLATQRNHKDASG